MKLLFNTLILFFAILLGAGEVYRADFAKEKKFFTPYSGGSVNFVEGQGLQVRHGVYRTIPVNTPGQYRVVAEVETSVPLQFAVFSFLKPGYGKELRPGGGGKFQIDMQFFTNGRGTGICLFTKAGKNAAFTVKSFRVEKIGYPESKDSDVAPTVFAAVDYPGINGLNAYSKKDGNFRRGQLWYLPVSGIPVPLTSKPLILWVKVRKAPGGKLNLVWRNSTQPLTSVAMPEGEFSWVKMRVANALSAMPCITLGLDGASKVNGDISLIVLTTDENYRPDEKTAVSAPLSLVSAFPADGLIAADGDLNEKSWNSAFAASVFRLPDGRPATEQTQVKFLYDENNLYFGATAFESALNKWEQRLHEFRNNLKQPDITNCYRDDIISLMIKREKENKVYEFCINASGIVTAMTEIPPDLWGSRKMFDSGVKAGGKIDQGKFFVEAALPFSVIGGKPAPGERFKVMIARYEQSRQEKSSFSGYGFHNVAKFGELAFASAPFPGNIDGKINFHSGENQLKFISESPALINSFVTAKGKTANYLDMQGKFQINTQGKFNYFASIRNPFTLEEILRLPLFTGSASAKNMQIKAASGKSVLINDGIAKNQYLLASGNNKIVTDDAAASFKIGNFEYKIDSSWQKNQTGMFTKNLLCDISQVWPDWTAAPGLSVAAGRVQQILFYPFVPQGVKNVDYSICFDLPENFTFEGACGYYKLHPLTVGKAQKIVIDGEKYNRYRINFKNKISYVSKPQSHTYVAAFIRAPENAAGKKFKIYFHCASNDGNFIEIPNQINLSVLETVRGKKMAKQHMQMWTSWLDSMDDPALKELIAEEFAFAGVTEMLAKNSAGVKNFQLFTFESWNFNLDEFVKIYPETKLVPFGGKDYTGGTVMCPQQIANNPEFRKWFDQKLPQWYKRRSSPDIINLDYEFGIFSPYAACVCKNCLKSFVQSSGLKETPSLEDIRLKYRREWTEFMTSQVAGMTRFIYQAVKRNLPHVSFNVYSGYQCEDTKITYSIDWNKIHDAMDFGGAGYGRPLKEIADTLNAVRGKPMIFGLILEPWRPGSRDVPGVVSEARLMQVMLDATGGALLFVHGTMDGRSMNAIAGITSFVANNEEFFNPGWKSMKNDVIVKGTPAEVRINDKGEILVIAYNIGKNSADCVIEFNKKVDFGKNSVPLKIKVPAMKFTAVKGKLL
ncbi:MAG: hypothetical protein E7051_02780 [Lentisphaerae bacterium]|nr:hypothetical protein [Lentisphaerota bacterium]